MLGRGGEGRRAKGEEGEEADEGMDMGGIYKVWGWDMDADEAGM